VLVEAYERFFERNNAVHEDELSATVVPAPMMYVRQHGTRAHERKRDGHQTFPWFFHLGRCVLFAICEYSVFCAGVTLHTLLQACNFSSVNIPTKHRGRQRYNRRTHRPCFSATVHMKRRMNSDANNRDAPSSKRSLSYTAAGLMADMDKLTVLGSGRAAMLMVCSDVTCTSVQNSKTTPVPSREHPAAPPHPQELGSLVTLSFPHPEDGPDVALLRVRELVNGIALLCPLIHAASRYGTGPDFVEAKFVGILLAVHAYLTHLLGHTAAGQQCQRWLSRFVRSVNTWCILQNYDVICTTYYEGLQKCTCLRTWCCGPCLLVTEKLLGELPDAEHMIQFRRVTATTLAVLRRKYLQELWPFIPLEMVVLILAHVTNPLEDLRCRVGSMVCECVRRHGVPGISATVNVWALRPVTSL